jgi:hypothetical protein
MARAAELQVARTHAKDDYENMAQQFPAYEALYAYCRAMVK